MKAKKGDKLKVGYKLKLADGRIIDETRDDAPLVFTVGKGEVLPRFEEEIAALSVGETKSFTLKAEDAYGHRSDALVKAYPRMMVPKEIKPEVGALVSIETASGEKLPARVTSVSDKVVVLDANHPLAGKDLTFEVKVLDVEKKKKK